VTWFYNQKLNNEEGNEEQQDSLITTGDIRIGSVGLRYDLDLRNNPLWPTDGFFFASELRWARYFLYGDLKYFYTQARGSYYFGILDSLVFVIGLDVQAYESVERKGDPEYYDVLPASERIHTGGESFGRGYKRRSLGPYVLQKKTTGTTTETSRDVLGGTRATEMKVELRASGKPA